MAVVVGIAVPAFYR